MVAFLDIVGPDLCKAYDGTSDVRPQLNHLLRQALLSCSGGVRLDEEVNGPMELLAIDISKAPGTSRQSGTANSNRAQQDEECPWRVAGVSVAAACRFDERTWRICLCRGSLTVTTPWTSRCC